MRLSKNGSLHERKQERALQRVDGAVDGPNRSERSEIMARPRARPAMLEDLRGPVIGRDQDVGKRLVVAQQHVEARTQPLDQIGFEQQRLGLGAGNDEFERAGRRDHALDAGVETGRPRIGANAVLDVFRLADIKHIAARIDHAVDAGLRGSELGVAENGVTAGGQRLRLLARLGSAASISSDCGSDASSSSSTISISDSMSFFGMLMLALLAETPECRCGPCTRNVRFAASAGPVFATG